jgi:hypothetical protein
MLAALVIAAVVLGVPIIVHRYDEARRDEGRAEIRAEDKAAADAQTTRNRELQRAAELRYVVKAQGQDRFFVTTVKEIRDAAAPLASCPVPADVVRLLNDAARCARGDSEAACGPAGTLPGP